MDVLVYTLMIKFDGICPQSSAYAQTPCVRILGRALTLLAVSSVNARMDTLDRSAKTVNTVCKQY